MRKTHRMSFKNEYSVSNCCKNKTFRLSELCCNSASKISVSAAVRSLEKVVIYNSEDRSFFCQILTIFSQGGHYPSGNIFPFLSPTHIGNSRLATTIGNSNLVIKQLLSETLTVLISAFICFTQL